MLGIAMTRKMYMTAIMLFVILVLAGLLLLPWYDSYHRQMSLRDAALINELMADKPHYLDWLAVQNGGSRQPCIP